MRQPSCGVRARLSFCGDDTVSTPTIPELRTLSVREAVQETGIAERTLRTLISTRAIPYVKIGEYVRFKPADLATWLDANTRAVIDGGMR